MLKKRAVIYFVVIAFPMGLGAGRIDLAETA